MDLRALPILQTNYFQASAEDLRAKTRHGLPFWRGSTAGFAAMFLLAWAAVFGVYLLA